jgi:GAF domain-containing protein
MKKKNKHGWYCKICGRFRANEKFSGKGHAQHICKDCQRQIHEEKLTKKQVLKKEKATTYEQLIPQVESLIKDVDNHVGALANVSALLHSSFLHYFWCGFYIVKGDKLELGPFQGDVACYTIKKGHGVCGKAWEEKQTIIVPNVLQFPDHIACSSKSRSEIVVPVFKGEEVIAVIDVDSKGYSAFDGIDKAGLEKIAEIISPLFG